MDVLLVDDHRIIHETLRAIVRSVRPGVEFHSQFDLAAGLLQASRLNGLDLVLLDLGLPGCSGMDALLRFRTELPNVRVAVISANDDEDRVRAALDGGAVGFLPKMLLPKVMADAIRVMLEGGTYRSDRDELLRLVDKPASRPGVQAYQASSTRRESRKLDTKERYKSWRKAAKEYRRKPQGKSERWVSLQIAKMPIAGGCSAETIRKQIRQ